MPLAGRMALAAATENRRFHDRINGGGFLPVLWEEMVDIRPPAPSSSLTAAAPRGFGGSGGRVSTRRTAFFMLAVCEFLILINIWVAVNFSASGGQRAGHSSLERTHYHVINSTTQTPAFGAKEADIKEPKEAFKEAEKGQDTPEEEEEEADELLDLYSGLNPSGPNQLSDFLAPTSTDEERNSEDPPRLTMTSEELKQLRTFRYRPKLRNNIRLLIMVTTAHQNLAERRNIRRTWGNETLQIYLEFQVIFLLGKATHKGRYTAHVYAENKRFGDILKADFMDTYRNLTLKTLSLMHFVRTSLPILNDSVMVMKVDDDVVIDPFRLLFLLDKWRSAPKSPDPRTLSNSDSGNDRDVTGVTTSVVSFSEDVFYCKVNVNASANRQESSKWYVSLAEWPTQRPFPPYCDGPAYFFMPRVAAKLVAAFEKASPTPFFWLEDVFVTGVMASVAGVGRVHALTPRLFLKEASPMPNTAALAHMAYDRGGIRTAAAWAAIQRRHNFSLDEAVKKAAVDGSKSAQDLKGLVRVARTIGELLKSIGNKERN